MLKTLNIENIAVIEKATVDFSNGLNVLTGETGAGKSIVVDSINAILGERTSKELVRHGADFAFVSALFEDVNNVICDKIKDFGFDTQDSSILLSRKIMPNGKTVCKINGMPSTVSILKQVGALLVTIHGQHDSQELLNSECHYKYIDMLSDDKNYYENYKIDFHKFITVRRRLKALTTDEESKDRKLELLNYQIEELENADIIVGERESLLNRKEEIENVETIRTSLSKSLSLISGNDDDFLGISGLLNDVMTSLNQSESLSDILERADNLFDETQNIKDILTTRLDSIEVEPQELENIEARLDLLYKLSLKYGNTEEEILLYLDKIKKERNDILFSDEELETLNNEYDTLFEKALNSANKLSNHRKETAKKFEKAVCCELEFLDMKNIKFEVDFEKGKLSSTGYDNIEFLISTNVGEPPKPLSKIASGGELSRIMLAIRNIIAHNDTVGSIIFDEIDTGVSGRASRKIGLKLKSVSKSTQVICVTHSAQIASVANSHFLIEKDTKNDRTYTNVIPLDFEERKAELARIMGGLNITESMLLSAQELLLSQEDI